MTVVTTTFDDPHLLRHRRDMKASKENLEVPAAASTTYRLFHSWYSEDQRPNKVTQKQMTAAWKKYKKGELGAEHALEFEARATSEKTAYLIAQEAWQTA